MMATNKTFAFTAALGMLAALAVGCGDDEGGNGSTNGGGNGGTNGTNGTADGGTTGDATATLEATLVNVLATDDSNPITAPHQVYVIDTTTGDAIPGFENPLMTEAGTGKFVAEGVPTDVVPALYVVGNPEAADPTYDAVSLSVPFEYSDGLLRISTVGLSAAAESTGDFTPLPDRAAVGATVYWTPGGFNNQRRGTIGCAEVWLDDTEGPIDEDASQRYNGDNGLPVPAGTQQKTGTSGRYYFGNLAPGQHTVRVTMDGGETFIGEQTFTVGRSRADARGPEDLIIYLQAVDVDLAENPTPDTCEGVY